MNKAANAIAERSTFLRIIMRSARNFMRKMRFKSSSKSVDDVDEKMIIFGAYNGKVYSCSPKAIYEYMLVDSRFDDYKFIWIFDDPEKYKFLEDNKNTILVKNHSKECEIYLNTAKYWILNYRALDHWKPKKNQVYVQCWHGTPLKKLGYDIVASDNAMNSPIEIRSKYRNDAKRLDYLLSPCEFVTEKFISAWNLEDYKKTESVLEIGYPRNDYLVNYPAEDIEKIKKSIGIENDKRKVILYAPTWRDNQHDTNGYAYDNPVDFDLLQKELSDEYLILFRAHYLVASKFNFDSYKGFIYNVSEHDDINELYVVSDMLITDYSSVFFDYAILNRPMLFFMYDMEQYRDEMRGFYVNVGTLPGELVKTENELIDAIRDINYDKDYNVEALSKFNAKYNTMNDGKATERLLDIIM